MTSDYQCFSVISHFFLEGVSVDFAFSSRQFLSWVYAFCLTNNPNHLFNPDSDKMAFKVFFLLFLSKYCTKYASYMARSHHLQKLLSTTHYVFSSVFCSPQWWYWPIIIKNRLCNHRLVDKHLLAKQICVADQGSLWRYTPAHKKCKKKPKKQRQLIFTICDLRKDMSSICPMNIAIKIDKAI